MSWTVREARERVPSELVATHDGLCGAAYVRGCPRCGWLGRDKRAHYLATPEGREASNAASRRRRATPAGQVQSRLAQGRQNAKRRATAEGREYDRAAVRKSIAARKARAPAQIAEDQARLRPDGLKWCGGEAHAGHGGSRGCGRLLPLSEFYANPRLPDGLHMWCRECVMERVHGLPAWRKLEPLWLARGIDPDVCFYTGVPLGPGMRARDHFVPRELGGSDEWWNLLPCHPSVNSVKNAHEPWAQVASHYPGVLPKLRELFDLDGSPIIAHIALEASRV